jgi:hypothetical protein
MLVQAAVDNAYEAEVADVTTGTSATLHLIET